MKYSLKQLAFLVLLISLALGICVSLVRIQLLENENLQLREAIGYKRSHRDGDSFQLSTTGYTKGATATDQSLIGSHLLRVENNDKYELEVSFYDGATKKSVTTSANLDDPIVAITYLPRTTGKYFFIPSTYQSNQQTRLEFDVSTHEKLSSNPWGNGGQITDGCFLYYFFYPPDNDSGPNASETDVRAPTVERIHRLCDKYQIQTAYFRILARDDKPKHSKENLQNQAEC